MMSEREIGAMFARCCAVVVTVKLEGFRRHEFGDFAIVESFGGALVLNPCPFEKLAHFDPNT